MRSPLPPTITATFLTLSAIRLAAASDLNDCLLADQKPYSLKLSVSPAGGYNSNVILLGENLPLPPGISRQDAGFFEFGGALTFDWKSLPQVFAEEQALSKDQFTAIYEYKGDFYEGISGFDQAAHTWTGRYTHLFNKQFGYRLEGKDIYTTVDGHSYADKVAVAPAILFEAADYSNNIAKSLRSELIFTFATTDSYFTPSLPVRNTSADNYSVEFSVTFIPKTYDVAKLKTGFIHYRNEAVGSDYDYDRNRVQTSLETRFSKEKNRWYDLQATIKYVHDFDSYDHANSHAGPGGFAFSRRDDRDNLQAGLSFDILKYSDETPKFAVNLQYNYIRQDSNVPYFNYPQHAIQVGCTYTFDNMKW